MNIIQKRARKTFIYSIEHTIITDRKTRTQNTINLEDHHEKSIVKQNYIKTKKQSVIVVFVARVCSNGAATPWESHRKLPPLVTKKQANRED